MAADFRLVETFFSYKVIKTYLPDSDKIEVIKFSKRRFNMCLAEAMKKVKSLDGIRNKDSSTDYIAVIGQYTTEISFHLDGYWVNFLKNNNLVFGIFTLNGSTFGLSISPGILNGLGKIEKLQLPVLQNAARELNLLNMLIDHNKVGVDDIMAHKQ